MAYPVDNFGDYLKAQNLVKSAGGDLNLAIEKEIAKVAPSIKRGGRIEGGVYGILFGATLSACAFAALRFQAKRQQEFASSRVTSSVAASDEAEVRNYIEDQEPYWNADIPDVQNDDADKT